MAEDDRSQLPLPSPGSLAEQRKRSKSTSDVRETSEETYELRKTADGEYEKKTTKSERHERKTSDEETFVATGLPSPTVSLSGIQSVFTAAEVDPSIDTSGDAGNFLCEYLGYHVAWYRDYINAKYPDDPDKKCLKAAFTHVGGKISAANAESAVRIQLEKLFDVLP